MLNRSLTVTGRRTRDTAAALNGSGERRQLKLAWSSRRPVTTSTPSKTSQQVAAAAQQHKQAAAPIGSSTRNAEVQKSRRKNEEQEIQARLQNLTLWHSVDTIKRMGHRMAQLDPLQIRKPAHLNELTWSSQLIEQLRSSKQSNSQQTVPTRGLLATNQPLMLVNELIDTVMNIYAGNQCGLEFAHLSQQHEIEWLTSQWEKLDENFHLSPMEQHNLARLLVECETFDHFMAAKFPTTKRYGCEGAESMLVVFDEILRLCHLGEEERVRDEIGRSIGRIDDVIIGMPHRGRLNLLACLLGFDPAAIFSKARGECELDTREAWMSRGGDVLSHLSTNTRFVYGLNKAEIGLSRDSPEPINVSLLPNPSHLELASPMVAGSARGRAHNLHHNYSSSPKFVSLLRAPKSPDHCESDSQARLVDERCHYGEHLAHILPIQVHGDASVAGQGVVAETLQMSNLAGFSVSGSLHLVVNNQIGYTTDQASGRSSRYCTDVFKLIEAPIIHVNAQNIASVVRATRLALAYRQKFAKDVAIDLVCYRQHGHNEMDEPAFTQPLMYKTIRQRRSIPQIYCDSIGLSESERAKMGQELKEQLQDSLRQVNSFKPDNDNYRNFNLAREYHRDHVFSWQTGCKLEMLRSVALASVEVPPNFTVHPNLQRVLIDERRKRFQRPAVSLADVKVDWATAEVLAFGSLLKQNNSIRISGQDVARGTFSTRHAVLYDQHTEQAHIPLNEMPPDQHDLDQQQVAKLEVANTILSEEAALAYEFGYSAETCALTIWEAQFGDFFNTAQSVIDTLVSSGEAKWLKQSALTLLLPHGLDGAGPEHSSGHLERFLQMSSSSLDSIDTEASTNWSVCFPTKPSQYFHLLRRQVLRPFRKPLVVMSPKTIFRHPECQSRLADFTQDNQFEPVLDDPTFSSADHQATKRARHHVQTVVLCSGKIYFALEEQRRQHQLDNVALVRLEELCPFPVQSIVKTLKLYPSLKQDQIVWLQEEHKNQGAFSFVEARLRNILGLRALKYIGRPESELPATGSSVLHKRELEQIMKEFVALRAWHSGNKQ